MDHLEYLISALGEHVLSCHRASPDFRRDTVIEFLEDQTVLKQNTVYIANASRLSMQIGNCRQEPGTILLISSAQDVFSFEAGTDITRIITDLSEGRLYNLASQLLRDSFFSNRIPASVAYTKEEKLRNLWTQIISGGISGHEAIQAAVLSILPETMNSYYRLSVIAPDDSVNKESCFSVCDTLRGMLNNGFLFPYTADNQSEVILLQFYSAQPYNDFPEKEAFCAILQEYGFHMLIGHATRDYGRMSTVYRLYRRANILARQLDLEPDSCIYHFEKYGMYNVIDMCAQKYMELYGHSDLMYLIHPVVIHITRYDNEHGTNLRDIMFAYITNNRDLKHTAELLYMHRNTLSNKLNLIRTVTGVDFNDGDINQRIIFSCQVIRYYENVLLQNIRTGDHSTEN